LNGWNDLNAQYRSVAGQRNIGQRDAESELVELGKSESFAQSFTRAANNLQARVDSWF